MGILASHIGGSPACYHNFNHYFNYNSYHHFHDNFNHYFNYNFYHHFHDNFYHHFNDNKYYHNYNHYHNDYHHNYNHYHNYHHNFHHNSTSSQAQKEKVDVSDFFELIYAEFLHSVFTFDIVLVICL